MALSTQFVGESGDGKLKFPGWAAMKKGEAREKWLVLAGAED